jgi:octaprenyl-diphosphate synthase
MVDPSAMKQSPPLQDLYRDIRPDLQRVEEVIGGALIAGERPEIIEMAEHAMGLGGKRMRPAMVLLVARAAGRVDPRHVDLGAVVEMIHLATLVHDDIIDDAQMRRRKRTLQALWNRHDAVLLGDIIFARAIQVLAAMGDARCLVTLTSALSTVCEGEIVQNRRARDPKLSEEVYYDIIDAKTAELYARGCELAAHLAGADDGTTIAFRAFGRELGLAFQITDDCLDLVGDEAQVGKSLGTDVLGGKMTLPLLMLRRRLEGAAAIHFDRVVVDGPTGPADVEILIGRLRDHGVLDEAMERARGHVDAGLDAVRSCVSAESLPPLEAVASFVLTRSL